MDPISLESYELYDYDMLMLRQDWGLNAVLRDVPVYADGVEAPVGDVIPSTDMAEAF